MNGMPLLSHPPPENGFDEPACRKCNKEFNFLFNRQKRCNHCGYAFCSSCADFQALMPRPGADRGYEALPVCSYCMDMLYITASSKSKLRSLPLSTLRSYMRAYDIRTSGAALEKDDLVEAILRAKGSNGCLLPAHEDYYRKHSVPQKIGERSRPRSFFSRSARPETSAPAPQPQQRQHGPPPGSSQPQAGAAPPRYQPQQQHHNAPSPQTPSQPRPFRPNPPPAPQSPRPDPRRAEPSRPPHSSRPYPPHAEGFIPSASQTNFHSRPPGAYPTENRSHPRQPPPRPRSAAPTVPPTRPQAPPPPVPSLDSLLQMTPDEIAHLSISTLKSILFQNRVNTSLGVLEKQDLVRKVVALVTDERRDREIKEREEREEAERMEWARREREGEEVERKAAERERKLMEERLRHDGQAKPGEDAGSKNTTNVPKSTSDPSSSSYTYPESAHDGLCVICQDEHANMAIVDCGHLALCKGCSEIVMKTTRECPLCRTRIVTEQRLLRIFKS
ncbi:hypothetical protein JB92DRAFT_3090556 [Gautieria morchelliformis]|nr:hypothetical protein JB92DRAFT_3090556 [Gautieria morchelliformis]